MRCEDLIDDKMSVLYGEADAAAAGRFEEHVATCTACRDEASALRRTRRELQAWKLPADLRPRRPWRSPAWSAGWGWAAAAAVLLALGGTLAWTGTELRYERGAFALRFGRGAADVERLLAQQDARHQEALSSLQARLAALPAGSTPIAPDESALLERVRELIRDSELRQERAQRARFADFDERADLQRRYDLARISAGLSYLDGKTGQHMARTSELMGYVLEASEKR
jgi:hypothetical protein